MKLASKIPTSKRAGTKGTALDSVSVEVGNLPLEI
jgi:hypothetical protein